MPFAVADETIPASPTVSAAGDNGTFFTEADDHQSESFCLSEAISSDLLCFFSFSSFFSLYLYPQLLLLLHLHFLNRFLIIERVACFQ